MTSCPSKYPPEKNAIYVLDAINRAGSDEEKLRMIDALLNDESANDVIKKHVADLRAHLCGSQEQVA